ncbi:MAG TPA: cytochrome c oxidase subunit II [Hyphomicrobiaceae bacterium]|nr:cytochrome c oxidase subunit II [Hyphomicrobiaceae bacterium]
MTAVIFAGCTGSLSTLDPAGPAASSIATMWWFMLAGATLLLVLVAGLLLLAFVSPGVGTGPSPQAFVLTGGLALPGLTLAALVVYALIVGEHLLPHPVSSDGVRLRVIGQRWHWAFEYDHPAGARRSIGVLHVPAGRLVEVQVTSTDVIHSFWVPRLAGKIDAIPGHITALRLKADAPGTYRGVCGEFCGVGHAGMDFTVQAHPEPEYLDAIDRLADALPHSLPPHTAQRAP